MSMLPNGAVTLELRVEAERDEDETEALEDWLRTETRTAGLEVSRPMVEPAPGTMGPVADVLMVALGSGGAGAALATSLTTWLRTRVSQVSVEIRSGTSSTRVSVTNASDAQDVLKAVRALTDHPDDSAP